MIDWIVAHEPAVRLTGFLGVFTLMALWEASAPRRPQALGRGQRWPSNLGIVVLDSVILRLVFPAAAAGAALAAEASQRGLLRGLGLPEPLAFVLAILLLDLAIYAQHVAAHHLPWFWRLHRVHHADVEFDVTTALRFHPLEILVSMVIKIGLVTLLGPPVAAVIAFEVLLNATAMFNHGNVGLPSGVDRALRWFLVTPDMHRVHHSVVRAETNSNYGFNLPWWDRLFRTYREQPAAGQAGMTIGLEQFRSAGDQRLDRLLVQPLQREAVE